VNRTAAFTSYWTLAVERQEVLSRRLEGLPREQWTTNPVLRKYRFTNAYRVLDRVSQYLLTRVLYVDVGGELIPIEPTPSETFFRVILFKLFNKPSTWELALERFADWNFCAKRPESWVRALSDTLEALRTWKPIYNNAYMMPPIGPGSVKHEGHLRALVAMMEARIPDRLAQCRSLRDAFYLLRSQSGMSDFLAMQYLTDLNYSAAFDWREDFVVPGPGARSGIRKVFGVVLDEQAVIRDMHENQEWYLRELGLLDRWFEVWLDGWPLQLIDCQNLFCETDKLCRVVHPDLQGIGDRTRIKQAYQVVEPLAPPRFPPKWKAKGARL
jgi:hypothetical protein